MKWQVRIDIKIKFRAFGRDLMNLEDHEHTDLGGDVQKLAELVGPKTIATYNQHGVTVSVSLVKEETPPQ